MFKKDYFMRLVEQLTAVLNHIRLLAKNNQPEESVATIQQALQAFVGLRSETIVALDTHDLINQLQLKDDLHWQESVLYIATLIKEEGDLLVDKEEPQEVYARYLKALELIASVLIESPDAPLPDLTPRPELLHEMLADVLLPSHTYAILLAYYEEMGQYDRAEDCLFAWLDDHPTDDTVHEEGIAFYDRILQKSDATLIAGGLPRAEALAALEELQGG